VDGGAVGFGRGLPGLVVFAGLVVVVGFVVGEGLGEPVVTLGNGAGKLRLSAAGS